MMAEKGVKGRPRKPKTIEGKINPVKPRSKPRSRKLTDQQVDTSRLLTQPVTPKKDWRHIDEIEDSEPDLTPSPPRRRGSPRKISPLPGVVPSASAPAALGELASTICTTGQHCGSKRTGHPSWPDIAADLFPQITAVVKAEMPIRIGKRGSDALTWHEKMLLYDPIVADDLADWLNDQGLRVRSLRSLPIKKVRKRKDAGEEAEQQKDVNLSLLKPWMVRAWCEENGVCAVMHETLYGRRRRR